MIYTDYLSDYVDANNAYKTCVKQIQQLKGKSKKFYVGATHAPEERLKDHIENKKMSSMYLLCKCETRNKTISLEKKLIKRYHKNKYIQNDIETDALGNIIQGGGGEGITHDINYMYVLLV